MKSYLVTAALALLLSSCLKQSIPDAMLHSGKKSVTATLSYEVNGDPSTVSVKDADNQDPAYPDLICTKAGHYILEGISSTGDFQIPIFTDTLIAGNYKGDGIELYILSYHNKPEYMAGPIDSISVNITSVKDGHISGNFSGLLSPWVGATINSNIYGTFGSVSITKGTFKNVPVIY
jgi:hypothetical protein